MHLGPHWQLYRDTEFTRCQFDHEGVTLTARGTRPADSSPLAAITGDHAYEFEVHATVDTNVTAGVLLFYNHRLYAGLGFNAHDFVLHNAGEELFHAKPAALGTTLFLRVSNEHHLVTFRYSEDGKRWHKYDRVLEVSGYHHNVAYGFLSLRPALYAAGHGRARFTAFAYRCLA